MNLPKHLSYAASTRTLACNACRLSATLPTPTPPVEETAKFFEDFAEKHRNCHVLRRKKR